MEENRNSDLERLYFCAMPQISLNMDLGMFGSVTAKIIGFYLQALFFLGGGIK